MDFYRILVRENKDKTWEVYPSFQVNHSEDLMIRGKDFYAVWDESEGLWSTSTYKARRMIDEALQDYVAKNDIPSPYTVKYLLNFENNTWTRFRRYLKDMDDSYCQLDENLVFANTDVKKTDYASKRLPYPLEPGSIEAWDELIGTLYSPEEREKLEWAIGAVVSGDSKKIQKFIVLYGSAGTGKSTVLNIIQKLFDGYYGIFEAKELGSSNNTFATEAFRSNPLVAIQHDGDLSRIEDNTKLNSIVSHEDMVLNEKFKASYSARFNAFLFMGTNQPVKISDSKSGIIRRLIDVHPTGNHIPFNHYITLMSKIDFELGAIAQHCLEVYRKRGKSYYNGYLPIDMMVQTDIIFNFVEAHFDIFKEQDGVSLKQAYQLYKEFCDETGIEKRTPMYKLREELRSYFDDFRDEVRVGDTHMRKWYSGFKIDKFKSAPKDEIPYSLSLDETESIFDEQFSDQPAQEATKHETPEKKWANNETVLGDVDTTALHFVRVPEDHIVIDFDLKDENGEKSLEKNLIAASLWPSTYAELSKSGAGVHLHYSYEGDVSTLRTRYSDGVEVKTFRGDASLRRKLTKCNNIPIATLNGGLPTKEKKMLPNSTIQSEKGLRDLIARNLKKEIHPGTKPSVDFIHKILDEAHESGMSYDVTNLRNQIMAFANNSTNQPLQSLKVVQKMRFKSEDVVEPVQQEPKVKDDRLVFYDVEVFPNLFVVCWKYQEDDNVVKMINPEAHEIEQLFTLKLIGFNNRRYDNHILYARYMGYDNEQLHKLSQKIIDNDKNALFGEAYNLSYADIYDFSSKKQGLKKFQIELGLPHKELGFIWTEPVPEDKWDVVVDYCASDVLTTEATFEARKQDFVARQILADLSGLTVNDTTQKHTARIIFGKDRNPQESFVYTDLSKEFPGYDFDLGKSHYRGELVGEGGYVYAEPGLYENVAVLDIASMHPTSIEQLNLFGPYTPRFSALKDARIAIKHGDYEAARQMLNGKLSPHLNDPEDAKDLSYALKIVINIVYGLTSAKFDNLFRDTRNKDNIVAKRGALFMIDLKHACQEKGLTVAHIKTDSIKIPNATPEDIEEIIQFGEKYGYTFEHEATYDKFCLVNDAVYIARLYDENDYGPDDEPATKWEAVGAQFQHPYVYKTLFSGDEITFNDLCEMKQVTQGAMYLDFEHDRPITLTEGMHFVGRTGLFVPVTQKSGGGTLYRVKDDKSYAVTGTKNHLWMEAEMAQAMGDQVEIDMSYFENLVKEAVKTINKFGKFEELVE